MNKPLIPYSVQERMAVSLVRSNMFGLTNVDQALALMAIAEAEGRHPAIIARDFHIIEGRPSKKSEAMLRDFLTAGGQVEWHSQTDAKADATFSHPQGGKVRIDWDLERAKKAGLVGRKGDMYAKYPRQMLKARCISEGVRTVYPPATSGVYTPEEVRDLVNEIPASGPVNVTHTAGSPGELTIEPVQDDVDRLTDALVAIREADDLQSLKVIFRAAVTAARHANDHQAIDALESAKNVRKLQLEAQDTSPEPQP